MGEGKIRFGREDVKTRTAWIIILVCFSLLGAFTAGHVVNDWRLGVVRDRWGKPVKGCCAKEQ